jgi:hypothetical protein
MQTCITVGYALELFEKGKFALLAEQEIIESISIE